MEGERWAPDLPIVEEESYADADANLEPHYAFDLNRTVYCDELQLWLQRSYITSVSA